MRPKSFVSRLTRMAVVAAACATTTMSAGAAGHSGHSGSDHAHRQTHPRMNAPDVYQGGNRHLTWCYDRYRFYRESDNTYRTSDGSRHECVSPYYADRIELFLGRNADNPGGVAQDRSAAVQDPGRRDRFGNLPETFQGGESSLDGNSAPLDRFGNLPEQFRAEDGTNRPIGQGQPSAEADETSTPSAGTRATADDVAAGAAAEAPPEVADAPASDTGNTAPGSETEPVEADAAPEDVETDVQTQDPAPDVESEAEQQNPPAEGDERP